MTQCTRGILLLFSLLFLCCSGEPDQRRHRQKRGLVKMMMHVMWDPVRLIRYWYAYDVTKEIAKSWRKILPTMVLHPFLADTPGVAKYLHPTHGLARTKKQTAQFSYPEATADGYSDAQLANDYLQSLVENSESPSKSVYGTVPHIIMESASNVDALHRHNNYKLGNHHGGSTKQRFPVASFSLGGHEESPGHRDAHHVYLQPFHQEFKRDNSGRSPTSESGKHRFVAVQPSLMPVPFPYKTLLTSSGEEQQHIVLKAVPSYHSSSEVEDGPDHDASSSSNFDSTRTKNSHFEVGQFLQRHPGSIQEAKPYAPYSGEQDHFQQNPDHQEIHIVLHPIPVRGGNAQAQPGVHGQAVHFVPYNYNANESSNPKGSGHFSFAFPTVIHTSESVSSHEEHSSAMPELRGKVKDESLATLDKDENTNASSSAEVYDAKQTSRVTWVLQRGDSPVRSKDPKVGDAQAVAKLSPLDAKDASSDHSSQHPLRLKGHRIDIKQLREDLKHGTPVLIPFDKKVRLPPADLQKSDPKRYPVGVDHLNIRGEIQYHTSSPEVDENRNADMSKPLSEEYGSSSNNSTQRLILFLAKKHSSQYRR